MRKLKKKCHVLKKKKPNCEITQILKLADKDFKVDIIVMLYETDKNPLIMNEKIANPRYETDTI